MLHPPLFIAGEDVFVSGAVGGFLFRGRIQKTLKYIYFYGQTFKTALTHLCFCTIIEL